MKSLLKILKMLFKYILTVLIDALTLIFVVFLYFTAFVLLAAVFEIDVNKIYTEMFCVIFVVLLYLFHREK